MKKCGNCSYLWADDYSGTCLECGAPMGGIQSQDLSFRYAGQVQQAQREGDLERSLQAKRGPAKAGDAYDRVKIHPGILERAKDMLVQREEVKYEDE